MDDNDEKLDVRTTVLPIKEDTVTDILADAYTKLRVLGMFSSGRMAITTRLTSMLLEAVLTSLENDHLEVLLDGTNEFYMVGQRTVGTALTEEENKRAETAIAKIREQIQGYKVFGSDAEIISTHENEVM